MGRRTSPEEQIKLIDATFACVVRQRRDKSHASSPISGTLHAEILKNVRSHEATTRRHPDREGCSRSEIE
jgi:hypothetical protein